MGKYQYKGKGFYALIVVDKLSRYVWLKYTAKTFKSRDVVNFLDKIIKSNDLKVGSIIANQGPQFLNSMWKLQCIQRGITAKLCSTHYPKTDGLSERSIQTLKMKLRLSKTEENIASTLATIVLGMNEIPHSATGVSAVKVMAAYKTRDAAPHQYSEIKDILYGNIQKYNDSMKERHDRKHSTEHNIQIRDKLLVSTKRMLKN
jgi:hypothetical protein